LSSLPEFLAHVLGTQLQLVAHLVRIAI
jgi:hypothetical protein